MRISRHPWLRVLPVALVGWAAVALFQPSRPLSPQPEKKTAACVLALRDWRSPSMAYSAGFQYELLHRLAKDTHWELDISLSPRPTCADSLPEADLIVLPLADTAGIPATFYISPVLPDSTVWIIPNSREPLIRSVWAWTAPFFRSTDFDKIRLRFTPSYEPISRAGQAPVARISPYDDLLRKDAARIGWDWRLLAALAWKESKFHIEARSAAGAEGLMQMMPHTARKHRASDMLDPEDNLRAATEYIGRLQDLFAEKTSDPAERIRFTLAAYNAGEGRVLDLIRQAEALGKPHGSWKDLEALLPAGRGEEDDPQTEDEELPGGFQGHETVRFMADIEAVGEVFRLLVP